MTGEDERQEAPAECPTCGAANWRPISYGMPAFSPELEVALARGDFELGGCDVSPDNPRWRCRQCGVGAGRLGG